MRTEVEIVPYRDGPYLVRGPFTIKDQEGVSIETSRRTVALCRCGKSRIRPFCDGTHRLIRFRASSEAEPPVGDEPRHLRSSGDDRPARTPSPAELEAESSAALRRPRADSRAGANSRNGSAAKEKREPSKAASLAHAARELREAQTRLDRMLEFQSPLDGATETRAARELLAVACAMLETLEGSALLATAARRPADRVTPCLCLVRGALTSLESEGDDSDDDVRHVVAQLRSAVRRLDLSSHQL